MGGGSKTDQNAAHSQSAFKDMLQKAFQAQYRGQANILGFLNAKLQSGVANPQGLSPAALAAERTSAMQRSSLDYSEATKAVQAREAAQGGVAGLPSGVNAQINASLAGNAANENARAQNEITQQNENLRQQNYWKSVAGLGNVAQLQDPLGYAGEVNGTANSIANISQASTAADKTGFGAAFTNALGSTLGGGNGALAQGIQTWG